jgi:tetratricopeptide (TPR) repeat protein
VALAKDPGHLESLLLKGECAAAGRVRSLVSAIVAGRILMARKKPSEARAAWELGLRVSAERGLAGSAGRFAAMLGEATERPPESTAREPLPVPVAQEAPTPPSVPAAEREARPVETAFASLCKQVRISSDVASGIQSLPPVLRSYTMRLCLVRGKDEAVAYWNAANALASAIITTLSRSSEALTLAMSGSGPLLVARCMMSPPDAPSFMRYVKAVGDVSATVNGGALEEGVRQATEYLKECPDHSQIYSARGTARAMMRDLVGAENDLERSCALNPLHSDSWKRLGQVRTALGWTAKGHVAFEEAERLSALEAQQLERVKRAFAAVSSRAFLSGDVAMQQFLDACSEPVGDGVPSLSVDIARERSVVLMKEGDYLAALALIEDALGWASVQLPKNRECSSTVSCPALLWRPSALLSPEASFPVESSMQDMARAVSAWHRDLSTSAGLGVVWRAWAQFGAVSQGIGRVWESVRGFEAGMALAGSLSALGPDASSSAVKEAIPTPEEMSRVRLEYAQALRAMGLWHGALKELRALVEEDPHNIAAWHSRGMLLHSLGRHHAAIRVLRTCLAVAGEQCTALRRAVSSSSAAASAAGATDRQHASTDSKGHASANERLIASVSSEATSARFLLAVCLHATGQWGEAYQEYCSVFRETPEHIGYCQRDLLLVMWGVAHKARRAVSLDREGSPALRESFAKRLGRGKVVEGYRHLSDLVPPAASTRKTTISRPENLLPGSTDAVAMATLCGVADQLGRMMQYSEYAFAPSYRQHRQCGLASIELAQAAREHWEGLAKVLDRASDDGTPLEAFGKQFPDDGCSKPSAALQEASLLDSLFHRITGTPGDDPLSGTEGIQSASALSDAEISQIMLRGCGKVSRVETPGGTVSVTWGDASTVASKRERTPPGGKRARAVSSHWKKGWHGMCWRDALDIVIKWRQLSEPFDPVFWQDQLTPEAFDAGFGLQTPLVQGQSRVPRYFAYYKRSLEVCKRVMSDTALLTPEQRSSVQAARSLDEMISPMNGRDFFVVTSCFSNARPPEDPTNPRLWQRGGRSGRVMEGTRLTALRPPVKRAAVSAVQGAMRARGTALKLSLRGLKADEGVEIATVADFADGHDPVIGDGGEDPSPPSPRAGDAMSRLLEGSYTARNFARLGETEAIARRLGREFTIRTPGTPQRWAAFEEELGMLWLQLSRAMAARLAKGLDDEYGEADREIATLVLKMFFFWANFGALTRGTAATAMALLIGLSLAAELPLQLPIRGEHARVQLDWEAILTSCPDAFANRVGALVFPQLPWEGVSTPVAEIPRPDAIMELATKLTTSRAEGRPMRRADGFILPRGYQPCVPSRPSVTLRELPDVVTQLPSIADSFQALNHGWELVPHPSTLDASAQPEEAGDGWTSSAGDVEHTPMLGDEFEGSVPTIGLDAAQSIQALTADLAERKRLTIKAMATRAAQDLVVALLSSSAPEMLRRMQARTSVIHVDVD